MNTETDRIHEIAEQEAGAEETREFRIFGPPGCGKTTSLARQIHRAVDRFGPNSVLVTSFSRTAAAELAGRDLPISPDRVGTLHSHCWHALGGPEIAEANVDEWNRENPSLAITSAKRQGKLDGEEGVGDDSETEKRGDEMLGQLNRYRGLMDLPHAAWNEPLIEFEKRWTDYKRVNGLLDFTDLIETCLHDVALAPKSPSVIFADEAQDLNRMQLSLIRKWGERANYFIVCGDDDQCQPPDTLVRTTGSEVPIEALNPDNHRLVSFAPLDGCIYGSLGNGYEFRKAVREYDGRMHTICAGGQATRCTPEHKFYVRWVKGDALDQAHVVYLMRRGRRYRVGWCKLIRGDGNFHLGVRSRIERADAAWILKVCYDRTEASIYESYVATQYGLPLATFEPINGAAHYTAESLDRLFGMLTPQLPLRAAHCLLDHGRDPRFPLYTPERAAAKRGGSTTLLTEAANLLAEIMSVPIAPPGVRTVKWLPLTISTAHYIGPVFSLDVDRHHTYIADGIVTHNCIYSFTGATPEAFLDPDVPDGHKIVLKQSYRVPRAVHRFAEDLIRQVTRRQEKEYLPRPADGAVDRFSRDGYLRTEYAILKTATEHIEQGQTVMFLASCAYMLRSLLAVLRKHGIPFHNPYRRSNGFWNPLRIGRRTSSAGRILSLLVAHPDFGENHRPWTNGDVVLWAEVLQSKGILRHGLKAKLKAAEMSKSATLERLDQIFEPAALESLMAAWEGSCCDLLEWWQARLTTEVRQRVQFPALVAAKCGPQALVDEPLVTVGTIHSVKGGQADVVYLFPDLSQAGDAQYRRDGPPRDAVIRQFYVGVTRAREKLYICGRESSMAASI
jgi:hypothetical protein